MSDSTNLFDEIKDLGSLLLDEETEDLISGIADDVSSIGNSARLAKASIEFTAELASKKGDKNLSDKIYKLLDEITKGL